MTLAGLWLSSLLALAAASPVAGTRERDEAQRHFERGETLMHDEHFAAAAREFEAAVALDPLLVLAHYNLGQARMALKEFPQAVQAYLGCRQALTDLNGLEQEQLAVREQQIDDQVRELRELVQRWKSSKQADTGNRIMMLEERIRVLESTRRMQGGQVRGEPAELPLALGSAYFRQGALADAEREYQQAVKTDDKLGAAHNNLAVIYMLSGRFAEAHAAIKRAEKAGFAVHPNLKRDLEAREKAAAAQR